MYETPATASILERFRRASVRAVPDRCLNRRHKRSDCNLCLACPAKAIGHRGLLPVVRAEACVGCGLCCSICPTGVFEVDGPRTADVPRIIAGWQGRSLELACPRRTPQDESRAGATAVLSLPCLAWASPALVIALFAEGVSALWLDDTPCAGCPLGAVHEHVVRVSIQTNRLLGLVQHRPAVFLYGQNVGRLLPGRKVRLLDPRRPAYTRRDLFGALRRVATEAVAVTGEQMAPETASGKLAPHLPAERVLLADALARLGQPRSESADVAGLPLAQITIGPACTACGLCAKLCPTGALRFRHGSDTYGLDFASRDCVGEVCHICRLICPAHAVGVSLLVNVGELLEGGLQVLRSGSLAPCAACGAPTAQDEALPLCYACRLGKQAPGRDLRHDTASLLG